jgi:hypothetical protein
MPLIDIIIVRFVYARLYWHVPHRRIDAPIGHILGTWGTVPCDALGLDCDTVCYYFLFFGVNSDGFRRIAGLAPCGLFCVVFSTGWATPGCASRRSPAL